MFVSASDMFCSNTFFNGSLFFTRCIAALSLRFGAGSIIATECALEAPTCFSRFKTSLLTAVREPINKLATYLLVCRFFVRICGLVRY